LWCRLDTWRCLASSWRSWAHYPGSWEHKPPQPFLCGSQLHERVSVNAIYFHEPVASLYLLLGTSFPRFLVVVAWWSGGLSRQFVQGGFGKGAGSILRGG